MANRDFSIKMTNILRLAIVGAIVLVFASWALPMFSYSGYHPKEVQDTISLWGFLGFAKNYPQIQVIMDIKYANISTLAVPLLMTVTGVLSIISCSLKKGIATTILPLIFGAYGFIGYFTSDFLRLCSFPAVRAIHIILTAITLIAAILAFIFNVLEIKSRPADFYLPKLGDF